jgi:anion-transporting  ArsA/GET3 family ATPase
MAVGRRDGKKAPLGVLGARRQTVGGTLAVLQETREAVEQVDATLDDVLGALQNPDGTMIRVVADRLHQATEKASAAVETLPDNHDLFA